MPVIPAKQEKDLFPLPVGNFYFQGNVLNNSTKVLNYSTPLPLTHLPYSPYSTILTHTGHRESDFSSVSVIVLEGYIMQFLSLQCAKPMV